MDLFSVDSVILIIAIVCHFHIRGRFFGDISHDTSAENSISKTPNLKIFWGRIPPDPPYKARAFDTRDNAPPVTKNLATALPIRYRIQFKISIFTYKALHGLATAYIITFLDTI